MLNAQDSESNTFLNVIKMTRFPVPLLGEGEMRGFGFLRWLLFPGAEEAPVTPGCCCPLVLPAPGESECTDGFANKS